MQETSDIGVVITCYGQGTTIGEAVQSVLSQALPPAQVVVVDDGSPDDETHRALDAMPAVVDVVRVENGGVSRARNIGIGRLRTDLVAVLDGDDLWEPRFLEATCGMLTADPHLAAASSWLRMFGVADHVVRPSGGSLAEFLPRNGCAASAVFRRAQWEAVGGYTDELRRGFEDWDFFLKLLERGGSIGIVPEPLLRYRTHPQSLNVRSMEERLVLFGEIIRRHRPAYEANLEAALLGLEETSIRRLAAWERMVSDDPDAELPEPSFGDGGMAAAVRIATARADAAVRR
jgi:glycosyltransferase involved in cell wall biosynthesis